MESFDTFSKKYLCKIRGVNRLSGIATQKIAAATNAFIQHVIWNLEQNVQNQLEGNCPDNTRSEIQHLFQDSSQQIGDVLSTPLSETFGDCNNGQNNALEHIVSQAFN